MTVVFNMRSASTALATSAAGPRATERGDSHLGSTTLVSTWKEEEEAAPQEVAAETEESPPEVEADEGEAPEAGETPDAARRRRRRGSRGGRGRKKPGTGAAGEASAADAEPAPEAAKKPAASGAGASPSARPSASPRRSAASRRARPAGARPRSGRRYPPRSGSCSSRPTWASRGSRSSRTTGSPRSTSSGRNGARSRGTSTSASSTTCFPGMEAAFVEIGLEKNGFLYVDEIVGPELEGRKGARKIQDLIKRGQTILVQAVKDPMKSKGARLTTELSLPGRFLVYVPNGEGYGVSRRLEDEERNRLKSIVKDLDAKGGGIIVRTAAEGASAEDIERDLVFLQRLWKTIQAKTDDLKAPALVYEEAELPLRIVRDLFAGDFVGAADRRRPHAQAHRQLPEEDLAAHDRARPPLPREGAALRGLRRRAGDQVDPRAPRRPSVRRLPRLRLRRGVHRHRRQHRALRRLSRQVRVGPARGHDRQEQPGSGQGGRPAAAAPRHRRDHRHRLHRHVEPEEPGDGRGCAPDRARARPDEDVRRRDLAARARRDDAAERHRRPARDPDHEVRGVRRRRLHRLRGHPRARGRAEASRAREGLACAGVPGRRPPARAVAPGGAGRKPPRGDRGRCPAQVLPRAGFPRRLGPRPSRPLRGAPAGQARHACAPRRRSRRAPRSSSSCSRSVSTTRAPESARSASSRSWSPAPPSSSGRRSRRRSGASSTGRPTRRSPPPSRCRRRSRSRPRRRSRRARRAARRRSRRRRPGEGAEGGASCPSPSPKKPAEPVLEEGEADVEVEAEVGEAAVATGDEQPKKKRTRRGTRGGRGRKKPATATTAEAGRGGRGQGWRPQAGAPRIHVPPADLAEAPEDAAVDVGAAQAGPNRTRSADAEAEAESPPTASRSASARGVGRAVAASAASRPRRAGPQRRTASPRRRRRGRRSPSPSGRARAPAPSPSPSRARTARVRPDVGVDRGLRLSARQAVDPHVRYHAAVRGRECPRFARSGADSDLRDHQGVRKAVPRPRGRAAARGPASGRGRRDVHARRAAGRRRRRRPRARARATSRSPRRCSARSRARRSASASTRSGPATAATRDSAPP